MMSKFWSYMMMTVGSGIVGYFVLDPTFCIGVCILAWVMHDDR